MNGKYRAMQSVARVKPNISRLNFLAGWTAAASTVSRAPQLRGSRACKGPKTMGKDFFQMYRNVHRYNSAALPRVTENCGGAAR